MDVSIQRILSLKFLPIIDFELVQDFELLIEAMLYHNVDVLQINFKNSEQLAKAKIIASLSEKYPKMHIGGGCLNSVESARIALDCGAKFLVSSILAKDIKRELASTKVPIILSGFTLTEIYEAYTNNTDMVQIFPASQLLTKSITTILEYLPQMSFILTGGLSISTALDFLRYGVSAVGLKGSIFPKKDLADRNYLAIRHAIKNVKDRIQVV